MKPNARRVVLVGSLALVLGVGVQFLFPESDEHRWTAAHELTATNRPAGPSLEESLAVSSQATAQPNERQAVAAPKATPPQIAEGQVLVVDGISGDALPDVVVHFLDLTKHDFDATSSSPDEFASRLEQVLASATTSRTGPEGLARVPEPRGYAFVAARRAGQVGLGFLYWQQGPAWRLELWPESELIVEVHDVSGRALANLPIALKMRYERGYDSTSAWIWTDGKGQARIAEVWARSAWEPGTSLVVAPLVLLHETPEFVWEQPFEGRLERKFVLPEVGRVSARVFTPDNGLWPFGASPGLDPEVFVRVPSEQPRELGSRGPISLELIAHEGSDLCGWVELGQELEVVLELEPDSFELSVSGSGPMDPLESRGFELRLGQAHPVLAMRLLDEAGVTCSDLELVLSSTRYGVGGGSTRSIEVRTDSRGRLLVPISPIEKGQRQHVRLQTRREPALEVRLPLPERLEEGVLELGDIVLNEPTIVASGRVIDGTGRGVADAQVSASFNGGRSTWPDLESAFAEWAESSQVEGESDRRAREHQELMWSFARFSYLPSDQVTSAQDGSFEIRASGDVLELKLVGEAPNGAEGVPLVVPAGATGIELPISLPTHVTGRLLLPSNLAAADISVQLDRVRNPKDDGRRFPQPQAELEEDGSWTIGPIDPGRWNLKVRDKLSFGWEGVIPLVPMDLEEGANVAPDIDLRSGLRTIRIEVVDESGAPIDSADGTFQSPNSGWNNDIVVENGRARILTSHPVVYAWIGAIGKRCVYIENLVDGQYIVLEPAVPVRLRVSNANLLPSYPFVLTAQLDPGLGYDNWVLGGISRSNQVFLDANGEALLMAPCLGTQEIRLELRVSMEGESIGMWSTEVEIETGSDQVIDFELPAEELREIRNARSE